MDDNSGIVIIIIGIVLALGLGTCGAVGCPHYNVWQQEMQGKAALARADQDREIKVREARAERDAEGLKSEARTIRAKGEAEAEIERARGVAEANRIIADGLGGPDGYLRYLHIEALRQVEGRTVIYVPTEAGIPVMEAGRVTQ